MLNSIWTLAMPVVAIPTPSWATKTSWTIPDRHYLTFSTLAIPAEAICGKWNITLARYTICQTFQWQHWSLCQGRTTLTCRFIPKFSHFYLFKGNSGLTDRGLMPITEPTWWVMVVLWDVQKSADKLRWSLESTWKRIPFFGGLQKQIIFQSNFLFWDLQWNYFQRVPIRCARKVVLSSLSFPLDNL